MKSFIKKDSIKKNIRIKMNKKFKYKNKNKNMM